MNSITLAETIVPFVCTAVVAPSVAVTAVAYARFRQRHFLSLLLLLVVAVLYLGLVSAFIVAGPIHRRFAVANQLNRLLEVTLLLFLITLPFFIRETFQLSHLHARLNTILFWAGVVFAPIIALTAFLVPDLFVSTTRINLPGEVDQVLWGAGHTGLLFKIRDALFGLHVVNGLAALATGLLKRGKRSVSGTLYLGFAFLVTLAVLDLIKNFVGSEVLLYGLRFQRFETGLAIFSFVCYLDALQRFFIAASQTLALQRNLEVEVSERCRVEAELRSYKDNLEELVKQRTAELYKTEHALVESEKLAILGRLIATVSHELRNPLGTVYNAMFTIRDSMKCGRYEQIERAMTLAERNLDRCKAILEDLLSYSRRRIPNTRSTELDRWLQALLEELSPPDDVILEKELASGVTLKFDPELLRQAFANVYTNALQALKEQTAVGRHLRITTVVDHSQAEIHVIDQGPGIPEELRERIFEPLFSTKSFGVGIGLAITRAILVAHGGDVEIRPVTAGGNEAVLWLPLEVSTPDTPESGNP